MSESFEFELKPSGSMVDITAVSKLELIGTSDLLVDNTVVSVELCLDVEISEITNGWLVDKYVVSELDEVLDISGPFEVNGPSFVLVPNILAV